MNKNTITLHKALLKLFLATIALLLTTFAVIYYNETKILYLVFTIIYFCLLLSGIYYRTSYSYLFLTIFLWLGIWLKLTIHLIVDYDYTEPVGQFYILNSSMDSVLIVSILGAIGVFCVNIFFRQIKLKSTLYMESYKSNSTSFYLWYRKNSRILVFITFALTFVVSLLNVIFGIQMSGLNPRTILFFPMNALISWFLNTGFVLLLATFISWDILFSEKQIRNRSFFYLIIVSALTSISLLSRGQFIFTIIGIFSFIYFNYHFDSKKKIYSFILNIFFLSLVFLFVLSSVTILRNTLFIPGEEISNGEVIERIWNYSSDEFVSKLKNYNTDDDIQKGVIKTESESNSIDVEKIEDESLVSSSHSETEATLTTSESNYEKKIPQGLLNLYRLISGLIIDRWIGLEGLMSVVSYPNKNFKLFWGALTSSAEIGKIDIYQYISNAHYVNMDTNKFSFATLPGLFAFLFYSGSGIFVLLGSFLFCLLMVSLEYLVHYLSKSALVSSIIGVSFASILSQIGIMPVNILKYLVLLFFYLTFIAILQKITFFKRI